MPLRKVGFTAVFFSVLLCAAVRIPGQSTDQFLPTPVLSNEINGRIEPLDLGDPRLTRHYYAFEGTPGDLLVTVDGNNLNGDVDIFTAVSFRPLAKATMYANLPSQAITKDIYLKTREIMILRVEARTPNDDPGTYHVSFGGTFAQFSGGIPVAKESATSVSGPDKSGNNRLTSVGATIPRPRTETDETVSSKPTPEKTPEPTSSPKPNQKPPTSARRTTSRRGSRPAPTRSTSPKRTEPPAKTDTAKTDTAKTDSATTDSAKTDTAKVDTAKTDTAKSASPTADKNATTKTNEPPKPQVTQPTGAHLIIERKDGTRIDRPMSTVRRVVVEGPTIVVVLKSGEIQRIPMANVLRMAIEPQQ